MASRMGADSNDLSIRGFGERVRQFSGTGTGDSLREALHAAVDEIVDRLVGLGRSTEAESDGEELEVRAAEPFGVWTYRWPDQQEEEFPSGRWYEVRSPGGGMRVRLAWTTRRAWGRDRGRAIVFQQVGGSESSTFYPLAEFVESDHPGRFASSIPDPERPRFLLAATSSLPPRFKRAHVMRADAAFNTIENGPSLRLIVEQEDEKSMVRHAWWVGRIRGRVQLKPGASDNQSPPRRRDK
jgi:hypothetical protein